ncbi:MAG TPA: YggS family pyridoxal phosphate-dependent enzyme [Chloroflexota bacterium]
MSVADRLLAVRATVRDAAKRSGRGADSVKIVAVTKTVPVECIREAVAAGQLLLGENRVQEAERKINDLADVVQDAQWHLIGHLQSNKASTAVEYFSLIQSVDTLKLAQKLNDLGAQRGRSVDVLLEVNMAGESSKFGFRPDALLKQIDVLSYLPYIAIRGLMTVAPQAAVPESVRWVFRAIAQLRYDLQQQTGLPGLTELSMGMSGDFEVAIEEGATMVRIGTAIFGPREPNGELSGR